MAKTWLVLNAVDSNESLSKILSLPVLVGVVEKGLDGIIACWPSLEFHSNTTEMMLMSRVCSWNTSQNLYHMMILISLIICDKNIDTKYIPMYTHTPNITTIL